MSAPAPVSFGKRVSQASLTFGLPFLAIGVLFRWPTTTWDFFIDIVVEIPETIVAVLIFAAMLPQLGRWAPKKPGAAIG